MANNNLIGEDSYYEQKGITAISNDNAVVPRDQSGNVIIYLTSSLLIVEAIEKNILAESVLPTIDTQFNYFKFPARTTIVDESLDLDLDLDLELNLQLEDAATQIEAAAPSTPARYKPSSDQQVVKATPVNAQPIDLSVVTTGPAQVNTNSFTIAQDLVDSGKDLKITGVITTQYNSNNNSEVGFLISGQRPDETTFDAPEFFYPGGDNVNDKNRVTKEGIYTTNIDFTYAAADVLGLPIGTKIFIVAYAEDQQENRNHTILANSTFVKFEAV
jgi:hypothetical protein